MLMTFALNNIIDPRVYLNSVSPRLCFTDRRLFSFTSGMLYVKCKCKIKSKTKTL